MNDDFDDLDLNNLERFTKQPAGLIQEVYDHCEVPAGCGGVVLRWVSPTKGIPVRVLVYTNATMMGSVHVDGIEQAHMMQHITPGPHLISLAFEKIPREGLVVMFGLGNADHMFGLPQRSSDDPTVAVASHPGTWRVTTAAPSEAWTALDFDDDDWPLMIAAHHAPEPRSRGYYQYQQCERLGAQGLGLPHSSASDRAWIRARINVVPTQEDDDV